MFYLKVVCFWVCVSGEGVAINKAKKNWAQMEMQDRFFTCSKRVSFPMTWANGNSCHQPETKQYIFQNIY